MVARAGVVAAVVAKVRNANIGLRIVKQEGAMNVLTHRRHRKTYIPR